MDTRTCEDGFADLFEHQDWVRRLASRLCDDAASADDIVQATWIEALRGRGDMRSARAWLGGIVRHLWRRDQRSRRTARSDESWASVRFDILDDSGFLIP